MPRFLASTEELLKLRVLQAFGVLRQLIIGRYGVAVLNKTENGLLLAPAGDLMVGRRLSFNGRYDLEIVNFLLQRCNPASEVLVVGAHVGALTLPLARKARRVVAVEPNPVTLDLLRMNICLNSLQNVEVHSFAAGDSLGEVNFVASRLNSGGSGLEIGERRHAAYLEVPEKLVVQMKRLDDVFPHDHFDLIVMDIEGAEALALRGMTKLLSRCQVLLVEVFESHLRQIAKVSNEEFLSLISPFFDEALILPEKPRKGEPLSSAPFPKSAFLEMMRECCKRRKANVMFSKIAENCRLPSPAAVAEHWPN